MKGSKVDMMPGVATTPRVLLEKVIENIDQTQELIVVVGRKDGYTDVYNTEMTKSTAVWLRRQFDKVFDP